MRQLSGELLLTALDHGTEDTYLGRIITMLAIANPETSRGQIIAQSLQEITIQLLALRSLSFGPQLEGYLACPSCNTRLEFTLPIDPVVERLRRSASLAKVYSTIGENSLTMRLATASDLLSISGITDLSEARKELLARCLNEMQNTTLNLDTLSALENPEFHQLAVETFDRLQADAEISIELICPECGTSRSVDLDIGRLLWTEVRSAAMRLMRDVHDLASAYGWQEFAILAMSDTRRRTYLEMIQ
jgi:hypothetical protein